MITISNYILKQENNAYRVINRDIPFCPVCKSIMTTYDTRKRYSIDDTGNRRLLLLRRLKCPLCNVLHLEMPNFLLPQKHYDREVILSVRNGCSETCPADDSTIRRWKRQNHPPTLPVTSELTVISFKQNLEKEGEEV